MTQFIEEQNKTVYNPLGLEIVNPIKNGMLQIEFLVMQTNNKS